jgi:hypothetical protein
MMEKQEEFKNTENIEIPEIVKTIMNHKEVPYILRKPWKDILKH